MRATGMSAPIGDRTDRMAGQASKIEIEMTGPPGLEDTMTMIRDEAEVKDTERAEKEERVETISPRDPRRVWRANRRHRPQLERAKRL